MHSEFYEPPEGLSLYPYWVLTTLRTQLLEDLMCLAAIGPCIHVQILPCRYMPILIMQIKAKTCRSCAVTYACNKAEYILCNYS